MNEAGSAAEYKIRCRRAEKVPVSKCAEPTPGSESKSLARNKAGQSVKRLSLFLFCRVAFAFVGARHAVPGEDTWLHPRHSPSTKGAVFFHSWYLPPAGLLARGVHRGLNRNQLFMFRTKRLEIAISATKTGLRAKISGANLVGHIRDFFLRRGESFCVARSRYGLVVRKVVKHQTRWLQVQHLARRERVDT